MKKLLTYIKSFATILILAVSLIFLNGCEENPSEIQDYDPQPMLTAFIYNGEPVDEVYFEWTEKFGSYFDPTELAIEDADIRIFPDIPDTAGLVLYLIEDPLEAGHYITPPEVEWLPEGSTTYKIVAEKVADNIYCTSTTVVPDTFTVTLYHPSLPGSSAVLPAIPDTLFLDEPFTRLDQELFLAWSPSASAGGFFTNVLALTDKDSLVALDPDWEFDEEDKWRFNLNFALEDQFEMTIPWAEFNWVGPYHIDVMSGAIEYVDYIYAGTRIMNQGINMDLPNNIEGGIGIFGGICRYRFEIIMERAE